MELGLTFPLQRFLKQKTDYSTQPDRRYCWDAHVIDLRGHKSLLAVNARPNRCTGFAGLGTAASHIKSSLLGDKCPFTDKNRLFRRFYYINRLQ